MISDLYLLETCFDGPDTAQFYEDLSRRYGARALREAIQAGYLSGRRIICGPDCGRQLFWLSESGRKAAQNTLRLEHG